MSKQAVQIRVVRASFVFLGFFLLVAGVSSDAHAHPQAATPPAPSRSLSQMRATQPAPKATPRVFQKHSRVVAKRRSRRKRRRYAANLPPRYRHRWDRRCGKIGLSRRACYKVGRSGQPRKIHKLAMQALISFKKMMDKTSPRALKRLIAKRDKYFHVSRWWWDRNRRDKQFLAMDITDRLIQPVLPQYDSSDYTALLTYAVGLLDHKALSRPREVALISRLSRWLKRRPNASIQQTLVSRFSKAIFQEQKCHWWYVVFISTFSPTTMTRIGPKMKPAWCKYRRKYLRSKYRMPHEIDSVMRRLHRKYRRITRFKSIGKSAEGRDIWALQVGKVRDRNAPTTLLVGSQHGDEHMGAELLADYAVKLLKRYGRKDAKVRQWLSTRQVWFIPVMNPDGYRFDLLGGVIKWWRYNRGVQSNGEIGVDLNRNWDFKWKAYSFYRWGRIELPGSKAFSEPETRAIQQMSWRIRKLTGILDVHQSGSVLLTPWAFTRKGIQGIYRRLFMKIGRYLTAVNRYRVYPARNLYPHQATLGDWGFGRHKVISLVLELGRTVYVNKKQKLRIFGENKLLLDRFIHLALDPFSTIRNVNNKPKVRSN